MCCVVISLNEPAGETKAFLWAVFYLSQANLHTGSAALIPSERERSKRWNLCSVGTETKWQWELDFIFSFHKSPCAAGNLYLLTPIKWRASSLRSCMCFSALRHFSPGPAQGLLPGLAAHSQPNCFCPSCLVLSSAVTCCLFCLYLLFHTLPTAVGISQVVHKIQLAAFPCLALWWLSCSKPTKH